MDTNVRRFNLIRVVGPRAGSVSGEIFEGHFYLVKLEDIPFVTDGKNYFNLAYVTDLRKIDEV